MRLIDLSQPVYDTCPNCPAHPPVRGETLVTHDTGDWHLETLSMSNHTGSHVDAPLHKIPGGASLDEMPLETFVGAAVIADLRDSVADQPIDAERVRTALAKHPVASLADKIVLIATGWGDKRAATSEWQYHSPYLTPDGAAFLVDCRIRGVGIDHYSIGGSRDPENSETHTILLGAGIWIVEDLYFPTEAFHTPPFCRFWALPINLKGHSGAWCRPVLVKE